MGAAELALEGRFVAEGEGERVAVTAEGAEGEGGAEGGGGGFVLAGHFAVEVGFLDGPGAELAPIGDDHFVDEGEFGFSDGTVGGNEGVEEGVEAGFGFAVEDDGLGEHAVGNAVVGGGLLAGWS